MNIMSWEINMVTRDCWVEEPLEMNLRGPYNQAMVNTVISQIFASFAGLPYSTLSEFQWPIHPQPHLQQSNSMNWYIKFVLRDLNSVQVNSVSAQFIANSLHCLSSKTATLSFSISFLQAIFLCLFGSCILTWQHCFIYDFGVRRISGRLS
jgi:hypothetical protein